MPNNTPFAATDAINKFSDYLIGMPPAFQLHDKNEGSKGQIKNQSLPFLMEIDIGEKTMRFVFPRSAESIRYQHTTRTSVVHTQAGVVADTIGMVPPKISVTGTFGYYNDAAKDGMDGYMTARDFEQLVRSYYITFQKYRPDGMPLQGSKIYSRKERIDVNLSPASEVTKPIRFYDFALEQYWEVNVDNFSISRSVQRKFLYMYELQMTATGEIGGIHQRDKLLQQMQQTKPSANAFLAGMQTINNFLGKLKGFLVATNRFVGTVKGLFDKVTNAVKQVTSMIQEAKNQVTAIINMPSVMAAELKSATMGLLSELSPPTTALNYTPDLYPSEFVVGARDAVRTSLALVKATKRNQTIAAPSNSQSSEMILFGKDSFVGMVPVARQSIMDSDTIYSIAQKNGVDWKQLVAMNGLSAPFISEKFMDRFPPEVSAGAPSEPVKAGAITMEYSGTPPKPGDVLVFNETESVPVLSVSGTTVTLSKPTASAYTEETIISVREKENKILTTGDMIDIPGTAGGSSGEVGKDFEESLFWIDEKLDNNGDMVSDGDVATKKGMSNLEMQLQHRLMTKRGELAELGHPEYGSIIPEFIGKISTTFWQKRIQQECEDTVRQDPRVSDVSDVRLIVDNTAIYFEGDVYPINQTAPVQISIPLS